MPPKTQAKNDGRRQWPDTRIDMKTRFFRSAVLATLIASTGLGAPAYALDDKQKQEIGDFIKEYLIAHPEIMLDVQDALQKKQEAARASQASSGIERNKAEIFNSKDDIVLGNPKGDVTIVEFFDYNCGYCRHALADMDTILKTDKNVRFVLKEFPILGPDSMAAHRVADAFRKLAPEKYSDFHHALLGSEGRATEESAIDAGVTLGVSEAALRKEMTDSPNDTSVKKVYQLAQALGINGTPAYVIGNELVSGAIGADALQEKLTNVRTCGKSTC
ncbi:thioredoxin domain-containing protein [Agrobacterium vitis]|nr:thioredoxin domain-containing protein [Agrobacterium vitis]MCF1466839.1 DsbA family protein [Agrobacterium vitis]MCM2470466.1 DsbA family protein [Agrobacterium vitis]MUO72271.1 thioredoxin domain-containing protein [Agrobacterium vitis]MUO87231.1 thioredoxin domain-containing protein [Agrobacterium vitis]